ncbi:MAG: chemotaxis protein CheC, partial [Thermodesulfobacteriota bacterium]|nr:chemotaxis protein CheC [Thermodesulfobacteriota bacterium]
ASMLNEMVSARVYLQVPSIIVTSTLAAKRELKRLGRDPLASIGLHFSGFFSGTAGLILSAESASRLLAVLTDEKGWVGGDLDPVKAETLNEVGNIIINGVMGSIGNVFRKRISYSLTKYSEGTVENLLSPNDSAPDDTVLLVRTRFMVREIQVEGDIVLLFEVGSFDVLLAAIDSFNSDSGEHT